MGKLATGEGLLVVVSKVAEAISALPLKISVGGGVPLEGVGGVLHWPGEQVSLSLSPLLSEFPSSIESVVKEL
jgi:hypothetical protein